MQGKVIVLQVSAVLHKKIKMMCAENDITIHDLFVDGLNKAYNTLITSEDDTKYKLEEGHERRRLELESRVSVGDEK